MNSRRLALVVSLTVALLVTAVAVAEPVHMLDADVTPAKPGTKKNPTNVELALSLRTANDRAGEAPPVTTRIELFLPSELVLGAKSFRGCKPAVLNDGNDATRCKSKSLVGNGRATFAGQTPVGPMEQDAEVTVYNGPSGRSIVFHFRSTGALPIDRAVAGRLAKARGNGYGRKIVIRIPEELRGAGGQQIGLAELHAEVKASRKRRGKTVPYIGLGRCRQGELSFRSVVYLTGGGPKRTDQVGVGCD
ncbi:MAG TPA: hypothetical protein VD790_07980 [Thermoleophilaceae bacterium]|nr:hypothetical protein [Thermoleophilaceae bacterium]